MKRVSTGGRARLVATSEFTDSAAQRVLLCFTTSARVLQSARHCSAGVQDRTRNLRRRALQRRGGVEDARGDAAGALEVARDGEVGEHAAKAVADEEGLALRGLVNVLQLEHHALCMGALVTPWTGSLAARDVLGADKAGELMRGGWDQQWLCGQGQRATWHELEWQRASSAGWTSAERTAGRPPHEQSAPACS